MFTHNKCRFAYWLVFVALAGSVTHGTEAINDLLEDEVLWREDGWLEAKCHTVEAIAGVQGNYWVDLRNHQSVGQTFRCAGPRLSAVQLGQDDHLGYKGLTFGDRKCQVTMTLRRNGPAGAVVAERTWEANAVIPGLSLRVNEPSDTSTVWYVEVRPSHHDFAQGKNSLNAVLDDAYPSGQLYLSGRAAMGDLHLRVYSRCDLQAKQPTDYVFWSSRPEERLWMDPAKTTRLMLEAIGRDSIELASAKNETESVQLTVTPAPSFNLSSVEVQVTTLEGPKGAELDQGNISIEWLRYSYEIMKDRATDPGRRYPDPLAQTNTVKLADTHEQSRGNVTFLVSLEVPAGQQAGIYRGTARVVVNGSLRRELPLVLEVFDFVLPDETHTRTGLFDAAGGSLERHLWWTSDLAAFRIEMGYPFFAKEHGILRRLKHSEDAYRQVTGEEMQRSFVEFGKLINEYGLHFTFAGPWDDTYRSYRDESGGKEGFMRFWETYYSLLEVNGWASQAYTRMPDELGGDQIGKARAIADMSRRCAPGVRVMVTAMGTPDVLKLSRAVGIADIWCPSSRYLARATEFYLQRQRAGEEIWPYIHAFTFHANDTAGGRMFFWMLEKYGFAGACYWTVGPRGKYENTWFGVQRRDNVWPGDGGLYYPGAPELSDHGLWGSLRLHRIRDGIEDREYFWVMNDLAKRARAAGKLPQELAARVADANALPAELTFSVGNFVHNPRLIEKARRQIAEVIVELQRL